MIAWFLPINFSLKGHYPILGRFDFRTRLFYLVMQDIDQLGVYRGRNIEFVD